jgi:hypothetical protein
MNLTNLKEQSLLDSIIGHIAHFEAEHWYQTSARIPLLNDLTAKFWKANDEFRIECAITELLDPEKRFAIQRAQTLGISLAGGLYKIFLADAAPEQLSVREAWGYGYTAFDATVKHFTTDFLSKDVEAKYLSVIKCQDERSRSENFLGAYFLPAHDLKIGDVTYGSRLLELQIRCVHLNCYLYDRDNTEDKYFFVEARTPVGFNQFQSIVHELLLVLNFLTGCIPGNEIYTLVDTDEEGERWDQHRIVSYDCLAERLTSSGFGVIPSLSEHIVEHNRLQRDKGTAFLANMVEACLSSAAFRRTLLVMVQAVNHPDYIRVVQFAVALEAIAKLFYEDNEQRMKPIADNAIAKRLRNCLKSELDKFNDIPDEVKGKFRNYLDRINSPTNADMLTKPFELLGIKLSDADLDAIRKRNDFLHGRLPADAGTHELSIIGYRLQFCVNAKILKFRGYQGGVLYHASLYQHHHHLPVGESPIRFI